MVCSLTFFLFQYPSLPHPKPPSYLEMVSALTAEANEVSAAAARNVIKPEDVIEAIKV